MPNSTPAITEHLDRIERPLESCEVTTCDPQLRHQCRDALASLAAIRERVSDLEDWIKAAHSFAWAHERTCPRHDADLPCECGLDAFLCRPRPVVQGFREQIAEIERERDMARTVRGYAESEIEHQKDKIRSLEERLVGVEAARDGWKADAEQLREQIAKLEQERAIDADQYARLESQAEAFTAIMEKQGAQIEEVLRVLAPFAGLLAILDVESWHSQRFVIRKAYIRDASALHDRLSAAVAQPTPKDDALVIPEALRDMDPQQREDFVHRFNSLSGEEAMAMSRKGRVRGYPCLHCGKVLVEHDSLSFCTGRRVTRYEPQEVTPQQ